MKVPALSARGFSLVEVSLALGVTAFALLSIFALLPVGLGSNRESIQQTAANGILSAVAADLRSTLPTSPPGKAATSSVYSVPLPANPVAAKVSGPTIYFSETGAASTNLDASSRYRLTVTFLPNGTSPRSPTLADLVVRWPAAVADDKVSGTARGFVALDRN